MNSKYSIDFGSYFDTAPVVEEQPKQTGIVAPRTKDIKAPTDDGYKPDAFVSDYMKILAEYAGGEDKARELLGRTAATYDPTATLDKYAKPFDMAQAAQDDAFKWSAARDAAGITQSLPTPGFEMRIGEAGVLPSASDVDTAELPARVAPVGRGDMLKGAGLASPMGGSNRGSVRPAEEETPDISTSVEAAVAEALGGTEEANTGEGLMSRRLDSKGETPESISIMGKIKNIDVSTEDGTVDMSKVQDAITSVVGRNIHSAALLGAIKTEVGSGVKDESPYYSLAGAEGSWRDSDVADALATLPSETQTRLKNGKAAGEGRGNWTSTSADRKLLGEAMFDKKYEGGKKYKGRGLIQITHKSTYEEVGKRLGLDLVANPELVNDPKYAVPAAIAYMDYKGYFDLPEKEITKNKLQQLINPGAKTSIKNERWEFAEEFLKDLQGKGGAVKTSLRPKARPEKATE